MNGRTVKHVETETLRIAYHEEGPADGWPVILSHGFPYDVHAFAEVAAILADAGARVVRPYTRGFGPTRFVSSAIERSGQQAARGRDIIQLAHALGLERPILGGFDWGGNASCVAAALWPQRIGGLVSYAGYDIIEVSAQRRPSTPSLERICWYQHLFQTEAVDHRAGLGHGVADARQGRIGGRDLCRRPRTAVGAAQGGVHQRVVAHRLGQGAGHLGQFPGARALGEFDVRNVGHGVVCDEGAGLYLNPSRYPTRQRLAV